MSDLQAPGDHGRGPVALTVNGDELDAWVLPHETLLEVLRDTLGHHEVRYGCGEGVCGTCTVLLDGEPVSSCLLLAVQADGSSVVTVLGLSDGAGGGGPHPLQASFLRNGAAQCGFCTPGMLLAAHALLEREPRPSRERIRRELIGNLCRCTGYSSILDAIEQCADAAAGSAGATGASAGATGGGGGATAGNAGTAAGGAEAATGSAGAARTAGAAGGRGDG